MAMAAIPPLFRCPISLELMRNPVTLCTGITYERESIEKWIKEGNLTCPATMQSIQSTELVPNITLQRLIQSFRGGIPRAAAQSKQSPQLETEILNMVRRLGEKMKVQDREGASSATAGEIRSMRMLLRSAGRVNFSREFWEEVSRSVMAVLEFGSHQACEEAVILISSYLSNLRFLNHELLSRSVSRIISGSGSGAESKSHAAAILERMVDSPDWDAIRIQFDAGMLSGLCSMLSCRKSCRAALAAIHSLSEVRRVRNRLIAAGAVRAIIELLPEMDSRSGTEMGLSALESMCRSAEGRAEFAAHELGMFAVCKKMFRVSGAATEFAVGIVWSLCKYSADESVRRRAVDASAFERLLLLLHVDCGPATKQQVCDLLKLLRPVYSEEPCIIASPDQALPAAVVPIYPRF